MRRRRARPAVAAFRAILDATEDGGDDEARRMRDLAWLSLGRVYYSAAHAARDRHRQAKLFGAAVDAYNRLEPDSEHWLQALFEASWALFVTDEHSRALGNIHALLSPFFEQADYPEALVVKAVIFFRSCQMKNASAVVQRFHERFDPLQRALDQQAAAPTAERELFRSLRRAQAGALPAWARGVLSVRDRALRGALLRVERIERERAALARMPASFREATVAARIAQDLELGELFAVEHAGELIRARLGRRARELQELSNQMDTIEIEILRQTRDGLMRPPGPPIHRAGREVHVDSEHVLWPFDGEYWRDELGYYRQQVTDRCRR